jgi:hypothetical protein
VAAKNLDEASFIVVQVWPLMAEISGLRFWFSALSVHEPGS